MMFFRVPHFNSIKVRLEPISEVITTANTSFQFHKGTIRTFQPAAEDAKAYQFQFHKGTIRTKILNSVCSVEFSFQFHKGTIRTQRDIASMTIQQNFNSIKVRLEHCYLN